MPLYDSLFDYQDDLKHVLTRHEQGAIHAAQGYARVSKKVGVCLATSGPGATNLITGLADAYIDSTPLVCITGQVASHLLGTDAFQETDVLGVSTPVTKWNIQITKASEIPEAISKAFFIARSGRPGPVLIDITKDAQFDTLNFKYSVCKSIRSYKPLPNINIERIKEAAELINKAARPMVLFGQGVILGHAKDEFKAFIEKAGIPAAWTILGVSAIPNEHPLNVGMLGMHGNYSTNKLTSECDVLIAVGMRFDDRVTGRLDKYAKQAKIIHLDIDPAEIDKNVKATVGVWGDCKETLPLLTSLIESKPKIADSKMSFDASNGMHDETSSLNLSLYDPPVIGVPLFSATKLKYWRSDSSPIVQLEHSSEYANSKSYPSGTALSFITSTFVVTLPNPSAE